MKVQEIIIKTLGNYYIEDEQITQALEILLNIVEIVIMKNKIEKDQHIISVNYQETAAISGANKTYHVGPCYNNGIEEKKDEPKIFIYY